MAGNADCDQSYFPFVTTQAQLNFTRRDPLETTAAARDASLTRLRYSVALAAVKGGVASRQEARGIRYSEQVGARRLADEARKRPRRRRHLRLDT